jgi:hypothetical protein
MIIKAEEFLFSLRGDWEILMLGRDILPGKQTLLWDFSELAKYHPSRG